MKGRILDLRLAPAAIIAWLGALVLPVLTLQWLPLIAALTLGGRCRAFAGQLLEKSEPNYLGRRSGFRGAGRGGAGN